MSTNQGVPSNMRRGALRAAAVGIAAAALAGFGAAQVALAQGLPMPKSPVTINVVDVAGNLALTQEAMEEYAKKHPNLVSKFNFTKAPSPVFQRAGEVVGVGHASFTKSPDGTEDWIVYHAHHDANNWQEDRDIRIQPFTYFPNGTPNFGTPPG